ncbi:unnamed protein product, partial [Aureobasidium uvarum]
YNQETHERVVDVANNAFEPIDRVLPWQRLETVLSVYIDMIESEKVVCLHSDVGQPGDAKCMLVNDELQWVYTHDRPDTIFADPVTGVKRNENVMFGPWIVQPYILVNAAEKKTTPSSADNKELLLRERQRQTTKDVESGQVDEALETAGVIARRPQFIFIAPGLQILTAKAFDDQPFKKSPRSTQTNADIQKKMPILLLRDATRLLLPLSVGGEDTWAHTSNGIAIDDKHDDLYQLGENPFVTNLGISLLAVLQTFYAHVRQENWSIDENRVSDVIDKFRKAETEEYCDNMSCQWPGEYW